MALRALVQRAHQRRPASACPGSARRGSARSRPLAEVARGRCSRHSLREARSSLSAFERDGARPATSAVRYVSRHRSRAGSRRRASRATRSRVDGSLQCRSSSRSTTGVSSARRSSASAISRSMRSRVAPSTSRARRSRSRGSHRDGSCTSHVGAERASQAAMARAALRARDARAHRAPAGTPRRAPKDSRHCPRATMASPPRSTSRTQASTRGRLADPRRTRDEHDSRARRGTRARARGAGRRARSRGPRSGTPVSCSALRRRDGRLCPPPRGARGRTQERVPRRWRVSIQLGAACVIAQRDAQFAHTYLEHAVRDDRACTRRCPGARPSSRACPAARRDRRAARSSPGRERHALAAEPQALVDRVEARPGDVLLLRVHASLMPCVAILTPFSPRPQETERGASPRLRSRSLRSRARSTRRSFPSPPGAVPFAQVSGAAPISVSRPRAPCHHRIAPIPDEELPHPDPSRACNLSRLRFAPSALAASGCNGGGGGGGGAHARPAPARRARRTSR